MSTVDPLPPVPSRASDTPAQFVTKADAFLAALPTFASQLNALAQAGDFNANVWVSGNTYSVGNRAYSPIDYATYRRKTNGAGTTDPSLDATNWAPIVAVQTARSLPKGRLTLTSATAVTTADVTGATTLYYTPHVGTTVPVWNGTAFVDTVFTELSQATTDATKSPAAVAASKAYDIFVWSDAGTLRATRGPAWSSDTSRGTGAGTSELQKVQGIWVNKNAITNGPAAGYGTYAGTVYSDGSSQLNDSLLKRHVWNAYNRADRTMKRVEPTSSWTYATATWRQANGSASNQLDFIVGLAEDAVKARVEVLGTNGGGNNNMPVGIALDATNANNADTWGGYCVAGGNIAFAMAATYNQIVAVGRHYLAWTEYVGTGTSTFYGTSANTTNSGMTGTVRG